MGKVRRRALRQVPFRFEGHPYVISIAGPNTKVYELRPKRGNTLFRVKDHARCQKVLTAFKAYLDQREANRKAAVKEKFS